MSSDQVSAIVPEEYWWIVEVELDETGVFTDIRRSGTDRNAAIAQFQVSIEDLPEVHPKIEERGSYFYKTWRRRGHWRGQYIVQGGAESLRLGARPWFDTWMKEDKEERQERS